MQQFTRDELVFDVDDSGPRDGPVVVLLHGWPQDRSAWARVTPQLAEAGLRVVAFDQRGYSPGARPAGRSAYRLSELVADVVALLDALDTPRVHLVGHDWGGAVAWAFAERHPERLSGLTVLSTPHHRAMAWALRRGDQALRSSYMAALQLPIVPEVVLRRILPDLLRRSGLPAPDADRYAERFREPGMAAGGLAWYRAIPARVGLASGARKLLRPKGSAADTGGARRISVPTTYVWGRRDPALGRAAAERTASCVAADYRFVELDAGHWLPEKRADDVAAAILARARPAQD